MAQLEFKYSSNQEHQLEAINAVVDLFRGQQFVKSSFTAATDKEGGLYGEQVLTIGHGNALRISARQLEENLHRVQEANCLPPTSATTDRRLRDFAVEMETGTGKTYVYIRTIYELNRRYGLTKFVIVVPSVAIREGVTKSFRTTKKHFDELYDRTPLDAFVYNSKDMGPVGNFATSSSIQVMVINIDAFNKGFEKSGSKKKGNLFHEPSERLTGGHSPQELVSACKPIVIIDEPQSVDNTAQAKAAIRSLDPLFVLRYSATHKQAYNMVYRLTPVDAFDRNLVKGICVDSVTSEEDLNGAYIRLESVKTSPYSASLMLDVRQKDGSQKRKKVTVKPGQDLLARSNENSDYENGWIVSNIGTAAGDEFIEFQNGTVLALGEAVGDVADDSVKQGQIKQTILDHLQKQFELYERGIKVLSLFFIDQVAKYRVYEPEMHGGEYAQWFETAYAQALHERAPRHVTKSAGLSRNATWAECYEAANIPLVADPAAVHQGYFAQDKKGHFKDSKGAAGTADDTSAFELIMQKKETLISFPDGKDHDKDVAFIFSHSALKEGWDNPNVFQICTLVETKDNLTKRQKIGRGLRLCVDQQGERCHDANVNVLTVIANESYDKFAKGLQKEFESDDFKFGVLAPESFTRVVVPTKDGQDEPLGYTRSKQVFEFLASKGLIDEKGAISPELKAMAEKGALMLPKELMPAVERVQAIIVHKAKKLEIKNKRREVTVELQKDVTASQEFQELWDKIRQRTRFEVDVDSVALIKRAVELVNAMPQITPVQVISQRTQLSVDDAGVSAGEVASNTVAMTGLREYDLPDPLAELQDAVGLTRATLKAILEGCGRFAEFSVDPATFLAQVATRINKAKNEAVANGIKYVKLPEDEWYTMKDLELSDYTAYLEQNALEPTHPLKSVYNYVVYDSAGVEKSFAQQLDQREEVLVFAKLPAAFTIDTPLGTYNPDWAYVREEAGEKRVYFVTETKGKERGENRPSEEMKIDCAAKHFEALNLGADFKYGVQTKYVPTSVSCYEYATSAL